MFQWRSGVGVAIRAFWFALWATVCSWSSENSLSSENSPLTQGAFSAPNQNPTFYSAYKSNYILFGSNSLLRADREQMGDWDHYTKFQFSFKFQFASFAQNKYSMYVFHIQRGLWDYGKKSDPMREQNYHPGAFLRLQLEDQNTLDLGLAHHSNGEIDSSSRSADVKVFAEFHQKMNFKKWSSKASIQLHKTFTWEENFGFNYHQTLGYHEINLQFERPWWGSFQIMQRGFLENFTYSIGYSTNFFEEVFNNQFSPSLFLEYFEGVGETLRFSGYKQSLRIGLNLSSGL